MSDKARKIAIASDHAGFELKEYIKEYLVSEHYDIKDFGTFSAESMDYPDTAHPLADFVGSGGSEFGIGICGSGNGVAMVVNKHPGIRAALCWNEEITKLARRHNDANIICLPARFISREEAMKFVQLFLSTGFEGGRHLRRVQKISQIL